VVNCVSSRKDKSFEGSFTVLRDWDVGEGYPQMDGGGIKNPSWGCLDRLRKAMDTSAVGEKSGDKGGKGEGKRGEGKPFAPWELYLPTGEKRRKNLGINTILVGLNQN